MLRMQRRHTVVRCAVAAGVALGLVATALTTSASAAATDEIRDSQQWVLNMLNVYPAWQQTEGAGVTIAVLDSGVNPDVSDLAGKVTTGPDLTGLSTPSSNPDWGVHGTWMASIIAGHGHDDGQDGIIGVAPQANILSIRVIPEKDDPNYHKYETEPEQRIQQALATGIRDAVKDGAQVISMSLGYTAPSAAVRAAVQYAVGRGVVLVASSGNSGQDDVRSDDNFAPVSFPAEYPGVLSVAALNSNGTVANFSSNNLSVQAAAPGYDVPAQGSDGQYWLVSGTSPACALVAGVAALIKSKYHDLAPYLVLDAITSTAQSTPGAGYNPGAGFGEVNAAAALSAAGRLAGVRPERSPVPATAKFGRSAALAPEPVPARGIGELVLFSVLAGASLLLAGAGGTGLVVQRRRRRRYYGAVGQHGQVGRHAVTPPGGYGYNGSHAPYFGNEEGPYFGDEKGPDAGG
jgi:type VII secretion-associated serine protease mycosin